MADQKYAGFWVRFVAVFIDGVILGVVGAILMAVLKPLFGENMQGLVQLALAIGYYVFYQQNKGQTLGKKVMKLKVVDSSGKTPPVMTFFLREIIGKFVSAIILGIGYLMVVWDPKKQALHDKIAGTYVVRV
jgi:uncharacterized RDD family membrane protein YckC